MSYIIFPLFKQPGEVHFITCVPVQRWVLVHIFLVSREIWSSMKAAWFRGVISAFR